jgi:hypothetical protein
VDLEMEIEIERGMNIRSGNINCNDRHGGVNIHLNEGDVNSNEGN